MSWPFLEAVTADEAPDYFEIIKEPMGKFRSFYDLQKVRKSLKSTNLYLLRYNFVETPRKFIIAKLSIRKLGSSLVLIIIY